MDTNNQQAKPVNEALQVFITKGNRVAIFPTAKKPTIKVRIRYNNTDVNGKKVWRAILNDEEYFCANIKISGQIQTFTEEIENVGIKHSIGLQAKSAIFEKNELTIM